MVSDGIVSKPICNNITSTQQPKTITQSKGTAMNKRRRARSEAPSSQQIAHKIPPTNQIGGHNEIMSNPLNVTSRRKIRYRVQSDVRWSFRNVKHRVRTPRKALFPFLLSTFGILTAGEHHEFNHLTRRNLSDDFVDVNNSTLAEDDKRRYNFCGSRLVRGSSNLFPLCSIQGKINVC